MSKAVKISIAGLGKLDAANHAQVHKQEYELVNTSQVGREKLHLQDYLMTDWDGHIKTLININHAIASSPKTPQLAEWDATRTDYATYIINDVRNSTLSPDKAVREAATNLLVVVDKYEDIPRESKSRKSLHINGLIVDLTNDENLSYVTTLGLEKAIEALTSANDTYESLRNQRSSQRVKDKLPTAKEIRPLADECFKTVCSWIESSYLMSTVEADREAIATLVNEMNQQYAEIKARYDQGQALKAAAKKKEQPPVTEA